MNGGLSLPLFQTVPAAFAIEAVVASAMETSVEVLGVAKPKANLECHDALLQSTFSWTPS